MNLKYACPLEEKGFEVTAKKLKHYPNGIREVYKSFQQQSDLLRLAFYEDGSDCR